MWRHPQTQGGASPTGCTQPLEVTMAQQVHKEPTRREEMDELADEDVKATSQTVGDVTAEEAADWLDSIDEALEEWAASNELAQAFVAAYVQKGGE